MPDRPGTIKSTPLRVIPCVYYVRIGDATAVESLFDNMTSHLSQTQCSLLFAKTVIELPVYG
jgi:hypothetical protein